MGRIHNIQQLLQSQALRHTSQRLWTRHRQVPRLLDFHSCKVSTLASPSHCVFFIPKRLVLLSYNILPDANYYINSSIRTFLLVPASKTAKPQGHINIIRSKHQDIPTCIRFSSLTSTRSFKSPLKLLWTRAAARWGTKKDASILTFSDENQSATLRFHGPSNAHAGPHKPVLLNMWTLAARLWCPSHVPFAWLILSTPTYSDVNNITRVKRRKVKIETYETNSHMELKNSGDHIVTTFIYFGRCMCLFSNAENYWMAQGSGEMA